MRTFIVFLLLSGIFNIGCNGNKSVSEDQDTSHPDQSLYEQASSLLSNAKTDSILHPEATAELYDKKEFHTVWSADTQFLPRTDTFIQFLKNCWQEGLFAEDYHAATLIRNVQMVEKDSAAMLNPSTWVKIDLQLTGALLAVYTDLKQGRLVTDSLRYFNLPKSFQQNYLPVYNVLKANESITRLLQDAQPGISDYWETKKYIQDFADSMDQKKYTTIVFPNEDSLSLIRQVKKRLGESNINVSGNDSLALANAIVKYQKSHGLKADAKISSALVRKLNNTDYTKFLRYAVTLDKYKLLPHKLPEQYIWANIPTYYLKVVQGDTVSLLSKIICGKPNTETPEITSAITDMVLYPTWTVPPGIMQKDIVPGLKRNPGYLARKGLYLLNFKGKRIDPYSINWSKYKDKIPFMVQQGSGDGNSLGVLKFNFPNNFSVYLHDTNQRYLFSNSRRSLSHGCVRVQEWKKLAYIIARNDSAHAPNTVKYTTDSIENWLVEKKMRRINVENKFPVYIVYFSCGTRDGKLVFFEDIYEEDSQLIARYFPNKKITLNL